MAPHVESTTSRLLRAGKISSQYCKTWVFQFKCYLIERIILIRFSSTISFKKSFWLRRSRWSNITKIGRGGFSRVVAWVFARPYEDSSIIFLKNWLKYYSSVKACDFSFICHAQNLKDLQKRRINCSFMNRTKSIFICEKLDTRYFNNGVLRDTICIRIEFLLFKRCTWTLCLPIIFKFRNPKLAYLFCHTPIFFKLWNALCKRPQLYE